MRSRQTPTRENQRQRRLVSSLRGSAIGAAFLGILLLLGLLAEMGVIEPTSSTLDAKGLAATTSCCWLVAIYSARHGGGTPAFWRMLPDHRLHLTGNARE